MKNWNVSDSSNHVRTHSYFTVAANCNSVKFPYQLKRSQRVLWQGVVNAGATAKTAINVPVGIRFRVF